jgi:IS30 family transposase
MYTVCSPFTTAQPAVPTKNLIQRNWGGPPSVRRLVSRWSKTQLTKIIKLPRATARATQKAAVRRLRPIGDFVHTITFDNGKEFATHQDIASVNAAPTLATPK